MINRVILTGRLTQDIELRQTTDGTPFVFFTIAVNRTTQKDQTDFISCVAWRGTAELMHRYLNKGSLIGVEGRLEVFRTENDGQYQTRTNVNVSNIQFLDSRNNSRSEGSNPHSQHNNEIKKDLTFDSEVNELGSFNDKKESNQPKNLEDKINFSDLEDLDF